MVYRHLRYALFVFVIYSLFIKIYAHDSISGNYYKNNSIHASQALPPKECTNAAVRNETNYELLVDINLTALEGEDIIVNKKISSGEEITFCFKNSTPLFFDRNLNVIGMQMGMVIIKPSLHLKIVEDIEKTGIISVNLI
jgi:hypothetical protein